MTREAKGKPGRGGVTGAEGQGIFKMSGPVSSVRGHQEIKKELEHRWPDTKLWVLSHFHVAGHSGILSFIQTPRKISAGFILSPDHNILKFTQKSRHRK